MRASGILLPVSSLPSAYGIGGFDEQAYKFVDVLVRAGQKYWQILPMGPTGYGDSPYQSFSTFAGNPYFISLDELVSRGYLAADDLLQLQQQADERSVDYERLYNTRFQVLRKAFENSGIRGNGEFQQFVSENEGWLPDYALFMAIKDSKEGQSFLKWEDDIKRREPETLRRYREEFEDDVYFYMFLQFEFSRQWNKLKSYANEKGVRIIGDIPIYVALDSADAWSHPELFQFTEELEPKAVAGCPPDAFSETGQLWGNPLYDWAYHEKTGFDWWLARIRHCFRWYDMVRIDHFRGFDEYYAIPFGEETAVNGAWERGPGIRIFEEMEQKMGRQEIIAEDLGFLTDGVRRLLADTGYPGMKVLQFAFDSREASNYLPYFYPHNCVVYTGTHDNDTIKSWFKELSPADRKLAVDYMNNADSSEEELPWDFIRLALASVADLAVIPIQDYLGLGGEARINLPSTLGGNWTWRMKKGEFTKEIRKRCREMNRLYGRGK